MLETVNKPIVKKSLYSSKFNFIDMSGSILKMFYRK